MLLMTDSDQHLLQPLRQPQGPCAVWQYILKGAEVQLTKHSGHGNPTAELMNQPVRADPILEGVLIGGFKPQAEAQ